MNHFLENKYPYLSNFFETAVSQNRLFHSIILSGSNCYMQYAFALELARLLNCQVTKNDDCNCQNCRWIKDNKHPTVMTVSKIDSKNDTSKTVVSEEQINMVLDTLVNSSDYHRVFIFCNADMKKLTASEEAQYNEFKKIGFSLPQQDDEKVWYPTGINTSCFSLEAANSMLKSLEEPSSNVTFIFLTNNKDDLLQTIVSRSQSFVVPDSNYSEYAHDFFKKYFDNYPDFPKEKALSFAQALLTYQNENDLEPVYVLDCIQSYFVEMLKSNSDNALLMSKIKRDVEKLEQCKKMLKSYVKEQTVYEHLAFYFSKNI